MLNPGDELTLALVQSDLHWQDPVANCAHFSQRFNTIKNADLVVLPEMFSTGFSMASQRLGESMQGQVMQWLEAEVNKHHRSICGSLIIEEAGHFFNRFVRLEPGGGVVTYDKKHLFRMSTENEHYTAGSERLAFNMHDFRICPQICYDLRFPVWSRNTDTYDLLLYVANWPASRRLHWLSLLQARAIENQSYVVGVNRIGTDGNGIKYCGDTVAFDYSGQLIANLKDKNTVQNIIVRKAEQDKYRQAFPVWKDADGFVITENTPK